MAMNLQIEFLKILHAIRFKNSFPSEENLIKHNNGFNGTTGSVGQNLSDERVYLDSFRIKRNCRKFDPSLPQNIHLEAFIGNSFQRVIFITL